jgi:hypothetical protein
MVKTGEICQREKVDMAIIEAMGIIVKDREAADGSYRRGEDT